MKEIITLIILGFWLGLSIFSFCWGWGKGEGYEGNIHPTSIIGFLGMFIFSCILIMYVNNL
jgi:hypothetical protein